MFRGVKLPNECSYKINSVQGHRQSLQLESWQLEERKKHRGREKKNSIIVGLRRGWLFEPGLKQTLSSPYTHSLLTMPVASHYSVARRWLIALIWDQPVI